ncbi:MAG: thioredoxin domain-containing protein [Candidatus Roizmanbacteria bacterium]|nr:MAG: thioredoxin domain-containing protein [Candidatus Roizmanbacteria bacterium]
MPAKNIAKIKVSSSRELKKEIEESVTPTKTVKGPSNLLIFLLIVISFFAGYLFFKVKSLEQQGKQPTANIQNNQAASPLSVDNLKNYAKNLKLDQNKFNACLDKGQKKDALTADLNQGSNLGVRGTPGFFVNGKFLGGAFPFEFFKEIIDKEINGTGSVNCSDYSTDLQQYCGSSPDKPFNPNPKSVDLGILPPKGPPNAKVTLVEFSDFQCPYCIRAYPTVKQILQTYLNDVKFVYKQFPLTNIHPFAQKAGEASLCAADQGKFWEYHDKLFETQTSQ